MNDKKQNWADAAAQEIIGLAGGVIVDWEKDKRYEQKDLAAIIRRHAFASPSNLEAELRSRQARRSG